MTAAVTRASTLSDPASTTVEAQRRRLALMLRIGFALSAAFLAAVLLIRLATGAIGEELTSTSRWWHAIATAHLGLCALIAWKVRLHSLRGLLALELLAVLGAVSLFSANALVLESQLAATFNVVLVTGVILSLRSALIPSGVLRTFLVSLGATAGAWGLLAIWLLVWTSPAPNMGWSVGDQLIMAALWLAAFLAAAVITSKIAYGLRREIHAARSVGQYLLHEKLGEGGMGVVYRATHALLKRDTAVKIILPAKVDVDTIVRFEREVVMTARLCHPNTVAIYDYGRTHDGVFYYAMEYLDALTLEEIVDLQGPLNVARTVQILAQVCASLEEAHEIGLIHRDIKPSNIAVTSRSGAPDLVKVLDFGLVKDVSPRGSITSVSKLMGTPITMSPEAISDPSRVGPWSDIYAVGAVGYYLLTGTNVFRGETAIAVCAAHLRDEPEAPSARLQNAIPPALERIILSALAKDPAARPKCAGAMRAALLSSVDPGTWTSDDARSWWRAIGAPAMSERALRRDRAMQPTAATLPVRPPTERLPWGTSRLPGLGIQARDWST